MLRLANRELALDLLDPADAADTARQGWRYCWGGYIWQVTDAQLGPLVSGPAYPNPTPTVFDGQGLPESFRHNRRADSTRLTWAGDSGLALGAGVLAANSGRGPQAPDAVRIVEPCQWTVTKFPDHLIFQTRQAAGGLSYELSRKIELRDRTITSFTQLTNAGELPLPLQWFPHPFWALTESRARVQLPAGTTIPENPGFAIDGEGVLTFKRPFVGPRDSQFALLALPPGRALAVSVDHPRLARVTFETSFVPDECPVWANPRTISVEPHLSLTLAPGETRHWHVRHGFEK
jgi:hypothetical protein